MRARNRVKKGRLVRGLGIPKPWGGVLEVTVGGLWASSLEGLGFSGVSGFQGLGCRT